MVDAFSDASKKFDLKINIKKTEVQYQLNSTRTREEDIMVDGNLRNTISSSVCIDDEMQRRVAKANGSFGRLHQIPCLRGFKARYTAQSCCPSSYTDPRFGQCTDDR